MNDATGRGLLPDEDRVMPQNSKNVAVRSDEPVGHHVGPDDTRTGIIAISGREYGTQSYLARRLGVATRTIARWDERRLGPPKIKIGNRVLYDLSKLPAWLESHEQAPVIPHTRRSRKAD
jgi:hypothetical protein